MHRLALFMIGSIAAAAVGCADDGGAAPTGFDDRQVVVDFADQVVVPTYELLAARAAALDEAVAALAAEPTEATLASARAAWVDARRPWEQSEGFLFGPVDSFGYDPAMDSWPVNNTDLDAVLAGDDAFTPEYVASLAETQKGFHTIEYLIFGLGGSKTAAELTPRELEYASAIAEELAGVADALATSWTESIDDRPPYRDVLATAGEPGNTAYPSLTAAAQEILDGMIGICDEVANGKIADPYDAEDPTLEESRFSDNSLADFTDNLRGVENAYLGRMTEAGTSGRGLSVWIAAQDPQLDARVKAEIAAAIGALAAIPPPFREAILDPEAADEIEAAQAAIRTLQATLEGDVLPLVTR
jgi:predicted lipoprotein